MLPATCSPVARPLLAPQTREFFAAFFTLSDYHWHGFLSTRLSFTELIGFGIALFFNASNAARGNLLAQGVPGEPTEGKRKATLLLWRGRWAENCGRRRHAALAVQAHVLTCTPIQCAAEKA